MNGFLGRLQGKLQEARISDVNHELGKVKETIVSETSSYWHNLRSQSANVGSLIRSESTRFSSLFGANEQAEQDFDDVSQETTASKKGLPKSVSLPAISQKQVSKYRYKSTVENCEEEEAEEDDDFGVTEAAPQSLDASVVDRFIRVVEHKEATGPSQRRRQPGGGRGRSQALTSREEIRKKLAFNSGSGGGGDDGEFSTYQQQRKGAGDLQICFINEVVSEDDEDATDKDVLKEDSSEDDEEEETSLEGVYPSSKTDWETLRNPDKPSPTKGERKERAQRRRLQKLQKEVQLNLQDCKQIARRHIEKERQKQRRQDPLRDLVGLGCDELRDTDRLQNLNIASLQVIVNHLHNRIENLNEELVKLLLNKDELEIEQDSQLLDIEDLSHGIRDHGQDPPPPL